MLATRISFINDCIQRFGYQTYLEIGCSNLECFDYIDVPHKVGVDPIVPSDKALFMTSNDFFAQNNEKFDIVFLDGLHHCEQVCIDIENALSCLNDNGVIVLHDCAPQNRKEQTRDFEVDTLWTGDVWKAFCHFRQVDELDMATGYFEWGCGVIVKRSNTDKITLPKPYRDLNWDDLHPDNYHGWLRTMGHEELLDWVGRDPLLPKFSIIIPTYNHLDDCLKPCIESIIKYTDAILVFPE